MTIEWNLILRLLIAGLLGGLIGLERMVRAKEVGIRTHFVVALGSALFMLISQFAFSGRFDSARVAAQVVSGIGFIGAGVIIFQKNAVRGITTASALWVAAAVGLACGAGMYDVSVAAAVMTVICLEAMHYVSVQYGEKTVFVSLSPVRNSEAAEILEKVHKAGYTVEDFSVHGDVAEMVIRIRQKDHESLVRFFLGLSDGLRIDIS